MRSGPKLRRRVPRRPSVDALVDGASAREPMESPDSKSGARFERVTIDGDAFVLKHVDRSYDWIARQSGDMACWPIVVWERGLVDLAPPSIDPTIVGAARTTSGGAILMRDVSAWLVPAGDRRLSLEQHLRFLDHLAEFHVACWGWVDSDGLWPMGNRYGLFGPDALECEAVLGHPEPVTAHRRRGLETARAVAPQMAAALAPLRHAPWPVVDALAGTPHTFLHGDWKLGNLGSRPDGRTVLIDWSLPGSGPPAAELAHYLALECSAAAVGHTKDDAIAAYRASLERKGIDTEPWWDRQLALCLLGVMLQLGWEKSFDETGDELGLVGRASTPV